MPENLGEILTGDRIENSDYELLAKLATVIIIIIIIMIIIILLLLY